ncbi:MAG: phosphotransferase [Candidatus Heimdallarchaeota archaeon]
MNELPIVLAQRIANEFGIKGPVSSLGRLNQNNWNWQVGNKVIKIFIPNNEDSLEEIPRWERESHALRLVGPQRFAPALLAERINEKGVPAHVRKHIPGKTLEDLGLSAAHLADVAEILRIIHTTHLKPKNRSNRNSLDWYIDRCEKTIRLFQINWPRHPIPTQFPPTLAKSLFEQFKDSILQVANNSALDNLSLIHGDLLLTNIIMSEDSGHFMLIDWEYSGYRDPAADISYITSQNPGLEPYREDFIQVYLDCSPLPENEPSFAARLRAHDLVLDWIFALWSANRALEIASEVRTVSSTIEKAIKLVWQDYESRINRIAERLEDGVPT